MSDGWGGMPGPARRRPQAGNPLALDVPQSAEHGL